MVTTGGAVDLAIALDELGDVVQFLIGCAEFAVERAEEAGLSVSADTCRSEWPPIEARNLGLGPGRTAEESLLVVQLAACQLAFALSPAMLQRMSHDFVRTARTLSAGRGKPN